MSLDAKLQENYAETRERNVTTLKAIEHDVMVICQSQERMWQLLGKVEGTMQNLTGGGDGAEEQEIEDQPEIPD